MPIYEKSDIYKWRFSQYVSPLHRAAITDWRKAMPQGARRADMDTFLRNLAKKDEWEYPDIDSLKGKNCQGLTEIRWKSEGVPHRLFGYSIGDHHYLFLIGCTHNAKKYNPPDAMETAHKRRVQIINELATYIEYRLLTSR